MIQEKRIRHDTTRDEIEGKVQYNLNLAALVLLALLRLAGQELRESSIVRCGLTKDKSEEYVLQRRCVVRHHPAR